VAHILVADSLVVGNPVADSLVVDNPVEGKAEGCKLVAVVAVVAGRLPYH
jgi:hypothetical protein